MAVFYYLISSLPMLSYDETPKITSEKFLESCEDSLSANNFSELRNIQLVPPGDYSFFSNKEVRKWYDWDTSLRNALVRLRAGKSAFEPENDLRAERDFFSEIAKGAQEAMSRTSPLEKEEYLDRMRWSRLTDLETGHNYDFSILCIYRLKLLLCEKRQHWDRVRGNENFDKIIDKIYGSWSPDIKK
jgi:hypothetical protein